MKIRFLSFLSIAGLSFCLSLPVIAQTTSPSQPVDLTEDTSPQDSKKPTQTSDTPKEPVSTPEATTESEVRVEELRNSPTTTEVEKPASEAVESLENQAAEEVSPTLKKPETSVPNTIKK